MSEPPVPPSSSSRLTSVSGRPLVVGFVPHQPDNVALTAAAWAHALGDVAVYFGYVDPSRYTMVEFDDGTVRHAELDPDTVDDSWRDRQREMEASLRRVMKSTAVPWEFRYLAGDPDRALTHLARAVDAAAIIVGTREPGAKARAREFLDGSVAVQLSHHQHRPVLIVPLTIRDWKDHLPWK